MTDKQFSLIMNEIKGLNSKFDGLNSEVKGLKSEFKDLKSDFKVLNGKFDDLSSKVDELDKNQKLLIHTTASDGIKLFNWQQKIEAILKEFQDRNRREHEDIRDLIERRFDECVRPIKTLELSIEGVRSIAISNQERILKLESKAV